ncbi:MAK10-like protein [Tanacetum coccineum]
MAPRSYSVLLQIRKFGITAGNSGSVVATENTGSDVVGMENEDSDGDGTVNGGVGYGEVIVKVIEQLMAWSGMDLKMAKTCYHSHWDSKPFDTLADIGSCVNIIPLYLFKKLNIELLEETDHIFGLADGTKSYPVGIVKDVEVHIGKLKLLNDFYVIDMKKDPETPLLLGRGFLATANAVTDFRMAKIAVGEESLEDLTKNPINWDKPPKNGDGAWHAKIRLIDLEGEEFTKTLQLIPTNKKLFEKESPREIIDLDHFYDT